MPRPPQIDWPRAAAALAAAIPREWLHPAVNEKAGEAGGKRGAGWGLAFSGGSDSLALLLLLWAHWPERRDKLTALHFDHRLRGRASTADAVFCRKVCGALGVRFVSGAWAEARKSASEAEARAARFKFFERELGRRRIRMLWFGHQQDDIAETLLMRLARGSGTAGLGAPRPVQMMPGGRVHLRPLLTMKKDALLDALRKAGAVWREDASNGTADYFRNRIRREVMPAWVLAATDRDAFAGAALSRELLDEDDAALDTWVGSLAPLSADGSRLDVKILHDKPRAVVRRALHRWLGAQADTGDLSRQGFATLLAAVERGGFTRFSLGRSGFAVIRKGTLLFERVPVAKRMGRAN